MNDDLQLLAVVSGTLIVAGVFAMVALFIIDGVRERAARPAKPRRRRRSRPPLDTRPLSPVKVAPSPLRGERLHVVWNVPSRPIRHPAQPMRPSWNVWPTAEYVPVARRSPSCTRTEGIPAVTL